MGEWFYRQVREVKAGPGKLLVQAERDEDRQEAAEASRRVQELEAELAECKKELVPCDVVAQENAACQESLGYHVEEAIKAALELKNGRR